MYVYLEYRYVKHRKAIGVISNSYSGQLQLEWFAPEALPRRRLQRSAGFDLSIQSWRCVFIDSLQLNQWQCQARPEKFDRLCWKVPALSCRRLVRHVWWRTDRCMWSRSVPNCRVLDTLEEMSIAESDSCDSCSSFYMSRPQFLCFVWRWQWQSWRLAWQLSLADRS